MDLLHYVAGIKQVSFSGRWPAAAHIDTGTGALRAEDHGASGAVFSIGGLTGLDAAYR